MDSVPIRFESNFIQGGMYLLALHAYLVFIFIILLTIVLVIGYIIVAISRASSK